MPEFCFTDKMSLFLSEIFLLVAQNNKCSSTIKVHTKTKRESPDFMLKIFKN